MLFWEIYPDYSRASEKKNGIAARHPVFFDINLSVLALRNSQLFRYPTIDG
jgi:hypothetical protein